MAQPYCTGAVNFFLRFGDATGGIGGTLLHLGSAEGAPERVTNRDFKEIRNDLSGPAAAFDYIYQGEREAVISVVLTRWNEPVATILANAPTYNVINPATGIGVGTEGIIPEQAIGTIMALENYAFQLIYAWQFGDIGLARGAMIGQTTGYRYLNVISAGPDRDQTGTDARKRHYVFRAFKRYIGGGKGFAGITAPAGGTFILYDRNTSGVAAALT